MLFGEIARKVVRWGRLSIIDADGRRQEVGGRMAPRVTIRLHDPRLHRRLGLNPFLYLGEAYMDGTLTIEQGTLYDFIDLCAASAAAYTSRSAARSRSARRLLRRTCTSTIRSAAPGQRRASLRPVGPPVRAVPRPRPAILLRLFHPPATTTSSRRSRTRSATSRPSCCCSRAEGARHRLGLGRARAVSRRGAAPTRSPADAVEEQLKVSRERAAAGRAGRPRPVPAARLPRGDRAASTASSRSACSSMSASSHYPEFFAQGPRPA